MDVDDASSWDTVAVNLTQGIGFYEDNHPTAVRPPVYPLFLAGIYKVFGHSILAARLFQIFLSALTAVLIFALSKKIFNENISLFSGLVCAVYPPLIIYSTIIGSETLFIFLMAASLYALSAAYETGRLKDFVLTGLLLGVTNLCRSTLVFYPFFLAPLLLWVHKKISSVRGLILSFVAALLVISPWTVRNYRCFGGLMLVNVSAGQLFWSGTLKETDGRYVENAFQGYRRFDPFVKDVLVPIEWEREMFRAGMENIRADPLNFAKLTALKFFRFWFEPVGYTLTKRSHAALALVLLCGHALFVVLAFYGMSRPEKISDALLILWALFLYFTVMHNLFAPMPRFRLPIEPFLIPFALSGLVKVQSLWHPKNAV